MACASSNRFEYSSAEIQLDVPALAQMAHAMRCQLLGNPLNDGFLLNAIIREPSLYYQVDEKTAGRFNTLFDARIFRSSGQPPDLFGSLQQLGTLNLAQIGVSVSAARVFVGLAPSDYSP